MLTCTYHVQLMPNLSNWRLFFPMGLLERLLFRRYAGNRDLVEKVVQLEIMGSQLEIMGSQLEKCGETVMQTNLPY